MNDFLILLGATTLSGSFLFGIIALLDHVLFDCVPLKKVYFFLKLSMFYFLLPGLMLLTTVFRIYHYEILNTNGPDIKHLFRITRFNNIALERLSDTNVPFVRTIIVVWLIGVFIVVIVKNLHRGYALYKLRKGCVPIEDKKILQLVTEAASQHGIKRRIFLYRSSYLVSPCLTGITRPWIIMPDIELSYEEMKVIFLHELVHYKNYDIIFRFLMSIVQGINWFNPLIALYSDMFYSYGELACDEEVSELLNRENKSIYAHLLIKLSEQLERDSYITTFSNDSEQFLKRRILIIMKGNSIRRTALSSILFSTVILVCCPLVSWASTWGAAQMCNEMIGEARRREGTEYEYVPYGFIEYEDMTELQEDFGFLQNSLMRGANSIEETIPAKSSVLTNQCSVDSGKGIKVFISGDRATDTFKVSISDSSGKRRSVNSKNGSVDYTFKISSSDTYAVYIENTGNSELHVLGSIYVNY